MRTLPARLLNRWPTFVCLFLMWTSAGLAQTVLMHQMSTIKVVVPYPGLSITVTGKVDFGKAGLTPGLKKIPKTSEDAGRFLMTGVYRQLPIYMAIHAPKFLIGDQDSIRYYGKAAFNDSSDNAATSMNVATTGKWLASLALSANRERWTGFAYVFLFGHLYVPHNLPHGTYTGKYEITLIL